MTEAVNNEIKPDAVAASELRSIEDEQKSQAHLAHLDKSMTPAQKRWWSGASWRSCCRPRGRAEGQGGAGQAVFWTRYGQSDYCRRTAGRSSTDADLAKRAEAIRKASTLRILHPRKTIDSISKGGIEND